MKKVSRPVSLYRNLVDRDPDVRLKATEKLGSLLAGTKECPPELVKGLEDANELVRIAVAESLSVIGDQRTLPKLWKAIHDRSPLVRSYVAAAIGELGSHKDIKKLEDRIRHERSNTARLGYYQALFALGKKEVFWTILSFLENRDYRLRCAASKYIM